MSRNTASSGGGRKSSDKVKLLVALGLFLVAGVVLAWYYGVLPGSGGVEKAPPPTVEQQKLIDESKQIQEKQSLRKDVSTGSS